MIVWQKGIIIVGTEVLCLLTISLLLSSPQTMVCAESGSGNVCVGKQP